MTYSKQKSTFFLRVLYPGRTNTLPGTQTGLESKARPLQIGVAVLIPNPDCRSAGSGALFRSIYYGIIRWNVWPDVKIKHCTAKSACGKLRLDGLQVIEL